MDKKELVKFLYLEIGELQLQLEEYGDYNDFIENVADGGNHNDTFDAGENYGWIEGCKQAYETILSILLETPEVTEQSN